MKLSQKIIEKFEYNEFYENFPAVILSLKIYPNFKSECLFISENCEEYTGHTANELMKDWEVFRKGINEKDKAYFAQKISDLSKVKKKFQVKFRYKCKNGVEKWLRLNANIVLKHDYKELQGILSDITEEKLAEIKEDKLKNALIHIARHPVVCNGEIENLGEFCSKIISETINTCRSGFWLYNENKLELNCDKLYIKREDRFESGIILDGTQYPDYINILHEAPYILANDARSNEATKCFLDSYLKPNNVFSLLDIPVFHNGKIVAVLCQEQTKRIRIWQKSEINFLFQVGEFISYCFAVNERKQLEKEMAYINSNLKKLVDEKTTEILGKTRELEERNKEILESILYARKIQASILPEKNKLNELLNDYFVYYKPKDIVAGDFYWIRKTDDNKTLFAVCDCTGHGIPGAFVSIMAFKILERTINEFKLKEPEDILKKANELFNVHFNRPDVEVRDGMDIALIEISHHKKDNVNIKYCGAYIPLYVSDSKNPSVIEKIAPHRFTLGTAKPDTNFKTTELSLSQGSQLYLFTDGCVDQFGGERGKKLKRKNLLNIISKSTNLTSDDQEKYISEELKAWQGKFEQLDDMCLIGIKI